MFLTIELLTSDNQPWNYESWFHFINKSLFIFIHKAANCFFLRENTFWADENKWFFFIAHCLPYGQHYIIGMSWPLWIKLALTRPKSLYISRAVSNFYGTEIKIWTGFGPVCNTKKNWGWLWAYFEVGFFMFSGAIFFVCFLNSIVASALKSCIKFEWIFSSKK